MQVQLEGGLLALAVGNARQAARMVNICPRALLDDGCLDCTVLQGPVRQQASRGRAAAAAMANGSGGRSGGRAVLRRQ